MKKFYFIHDNDRKPILTIGLFVNENGIDKARVLTVYGNSETTPLSKTQAINTVENRFKDANEILERPKFNNFIPQKKLWKRVKNQPAHFLVPLRDKQGKVIKIKGVTQYDAPKRNTELTDRNAKELILDQDSLKKIDLNPVFTDFENFLVTPPSQN